MTFADESDVGKQDVRLLGDGLSGGDVTNDATYHSYAGNKLQQLFEGSKSKIIINQFNNVKTTKIEKIPVTFGLIQTLYEKRKIYESCTPSPMIQTSSGYRHKPEDYNVWDLTMDTDPENMEEKEYIMRVEGTDYLLECNTCGTTGEVVCDNCNNGYEVCPECDGYGTLWCGTCNGNGTVNCHSCGGYGSFTRIETEYVREGDYEVPTYVKVEEYCHTCLGKGYLTCSSCGGSGKLCCNTCGGDGSIICHKCRGRRYVICPSCNGCGHFLCEIMAKQNYIVNNLRSLIGIYKLPEKYMNYSIMVADNENCTAIAEITGENHIGNIPWQEILPPDYVEEKYISEETRKLLQTENRKIEGNRPVRQKLHIYQKELLDVTYLLNGMEYNVLMDMGNDDIYIPYSLFENIISGVVDVMEENISEEKYDVFYDTYKDIRFLTANDIKLSVYNQRIRKMYGKITNLFFLYLMAGHFAALLLDVLVVGLA